MSLVPLAPFLALLGMTAKEYASLFLDRFGLGRVLLGVNHHALERIDCAQHLRVGAPDEILVFFRLDRVAAAPRREKLPFLLHAHRNSNVWRHPVAVDDLLTRGVIFRSGKAQRRAIWQLHHVL